MHAQVLSAAVVRHLARSRELRRFVAQSEEVTAATLGGAQDLQARPFDQARPCGARTSHGYGTPCTLATLTTRTTPFTPARPIHTGSPHSHRLPRLEQAEDAALGFWLSRAQLQRRLNLTCVDATSCLHRPSHALPCHTPLTVPRTLTMPHALTK